MSILNAKAWGGGGGGGGDSLAYLKANDNTKTPLMKNVNCIMSHSLFL